MHSDGIVTTVKVLLEIGWLRKTQNPLACSNSEILRGKHYEVFQPRVWGYFLIRPKLHMLGRSPWAPPLKTFWCFLCFCFFSFSVSSLAATKVVIRLSPIQSAQVSQSPAHEKNAVPRLVLNLEHYRTLVQVHRLFSNTVLSQKSDRFL